jgi:PTS system nitrogen regulatory IIA component
VSEDNFDIESLASYLHLPKNQLQKMADRGQVPGRRIKGGWSFSSSEIHHWLESRLGATDDDAELATVEQILNKSAPSDETISIATLIPSGGIELPLAARTKDSVIRTMTSVAARTGMLWDSVKMCDALRKREELHPTALDIGVALMHPRRPMGNIIDDTFIVLGISTAGIPFGGGFENLTNIFFLICSKDDRIHLRVLARLSRLLTVKDFMNELRNAESEKEIRNVIVESESNII